MEKLIGRGKVLTSTGWPTGLGPEREFLRTEVVAFGKAMCWGSAAIHFWIRLSDGTELSVKACDQSKDAEKWLRRLGKKFGRIWISDRNFKMEWKPIEAIS